MLLKIIAATLLLVVALILVRHLTMRADEARVRARKPARAAARRNIVTTLRQDPKTGVYQPDE